MFRYFFLFFVVFLMGAASHEGPGKILETESIYSFVIAEYELGVPCVKARSFGPAAVAQLVSMLSSHDFEPYWENIVVTLGCIGDPAAVTPLKNFLKGHRGQITFDVFTAIQGIPTALGFISEQGDQEAMRLLSEMADEEYWKKARLSVFDNIVIDNTTLNKNLIRSTIVALGHVGSEKAVGTLKHLMLDPSLDKDILADIDSAIRNNVE